FTITTGQQLGWLTGPLYTIVKAVHAIQLAQELEVLFKGKYRFIPIFWLASEDHDAMEVRSVRINWEEKLSYEGSFRGPVGRHRIENKFPQRANSLELRQFWRVGSTWEEAFRDAMHYLFKGKGIVWLSGDNPLLKALATSLWQREIQESLTYHAHALAISYLKKIGEKPRLHAQPINIFWLSDNERRYPLAEEYPLLKSAIYTAPERISPNVLLRPLYQELLLPNIAYVAGPSEVAYWIELSPVFQAFDIPMPVIYPRGHVRILRPPLPHLPSHLSWESVWSLSEAQLKKNLLEKWEEESLNELRIWWERNRPPFEELLAYPHLRKLTQSFVRGWRKSAEQSYRATLRKAYHTHRGAIQAILRYKRSIEPEGFFQERELNIHAFTENNTAKWVEKFIEQVKLLPGKWLNLLFCEKNGFTFAYLS
ncbi:MAG: bacillithiol biosynthesis BshC, partial [Bacteroidia bacterium]|nr:bacillithiol biosynthesis cysteine-adding enzyme BshC [Bacteroidia bacterium]MDW8134934.1 bacillithiol biosynthesis BshC [Bacteroidia bacterium]